MELRYTIGRGIGCRIVAAHPMVSSYHADLVVNVYSCGNSYMLCDHSTNGTKVNGQMLHLASCYVAYGDEILLASVYPLDWRSIDVGRSYEVTDTPEIRIRPSWFSALSEFFFRMFDYDGSTGQTMYLFSLSWLLLALFILISVVLRMSMQNIPSILLFAISVLLFLPVFLSAFALSIRRLNDSRSSRAWVLLLFLPVINIIF